MIDLSVLKGIFGGVKLFARETAQETVAEGAIKGIGAIVKTFLGKTAEVAPQFILNHIENQLDPDKADERLVNEAKAIISVKKPNIHKLWNERIGWLTEGVTPQVALLRCDAFRQTLNLKDIDKLIADIERICGLDDTAFKSEMVENGWDCPNPKSVWDAIKQRRQRISDQLHVHPIRTDLKNRANEAVAAAKKARW